MSSSSVENICLQIRTSTMTNFHGLIYLLDVLTLPTRTKTGRRLSLTQCAGVNTNHSDIIMLAHWNEILYSEYR